jgi:hypothetical protein
MSATAIPGENHSQFEHYLLIVRNAVREARLRRTMLTLPRNALPHPVIFFLDASNSARGGTVRMGLRSEVRDRGPAEHHGHVRIRYRPRDQVAAGHADLQRRASVDDAVLGFGWAVIQPCAGHVAALG